MRLPFKNLTIFAGYIGNEPVLRHLQSGDATVSVRIVCRNAYKVGDEWHTTDEWATAIFYRNLAEALEAQGLCGKVKGRFIHVEGRRHTRRWTDSAGHEKSTQEIVVTDWHEIHLAKKPSAEDLPPAPSKPARKKAEQQAQETPRSRMTNLA